MAKQASNQISTLEVFGEDNDSRKKRFETSLHDNRFIELKPLREAQRERDIASGLIPDPLKPRRLDQATDFLGTCTDMCPEFEREEREYQNNVDLLERYPGTTRIDPQRAVKAFHRPAAGNDQPLPSDVRPPAVLKATLDYLFRELMPKHDFAASHPFLRDRTRAVRQDFTMQNERGTVAIECNERIARYHVLALGIQREQTGFSESQELEQLRKVLKSLNEFYDDARLSDPPIPAPNEAEFRSYNILTHLRDPDIIWSTELLPPHVFHHPNLQIALALHSLAQRSSLARGERASPNAFSRLFKLLESTEVPYLFACLLSSHFSEIRKNGLDALRNAYLVQHSGLPARRLVKMLGCDDEDEVKELCEAFGVMTDVGEDGQLLVQLNKTTPLKNGTQKGHVSRRIVEAKRGAYSYPDVIDGLVQVAEAVSAAPTSPRSMSTITPRFSVATPLPSRPSSTAPTSQPTFLQPKPAAPPFAPTSSSPFGPGSAFPKPAPAVATPIPSFPSTRAPSPALPATPAFGASLVPPSVPVGGRLNPVASAFVPPDRSAFGAATPSQPSVAANPFGLQSAPPKPPSGRPTSASPIAAPAPSNAPAPFSTITPAPKPPVLPPVSVSSTVKPTLPPVTAPPPPAVRPSISPLSTMPAGPPPPKPRNPQLVAWTREVVRVLADDLLQAAVAGPVRRAAEEGLVWRWKEEAQTRQRLVAEHARGLADWVVGSIVHGAVRRMARDEAEMQESIRTVLRGWRVGAQRRKVRRLEEEERRRKFKLVAGEIGVGPEYEAGDVDDAVSVSSSRLRGLTLGQPSAGRKKGEHSLASKVESAQLQRERLWAPGTFLELLADRVEPTIVEARQVLGARPTWTAVVSTRDGGSAFARWLSCKFGLDDDSRSIMVESATARVEVHLVEDGQDAGSLLESTGLVVFDCLQPSGQDDDSFWSTTRQRMDTLIATAAASSIYPTSLLIVTCPSRKMSVKEQSVLRAEVVAKLQPGRLGSQVSKVGAWVVSLEGGEEGQLERHLAQLLPGQVRVRRERVRVPLSGLVKPMVDVWRASLTDALTAAPPVSVLSPYTNALNSVLDEARACADDGGATLSPVPGPPPDLAQLSAYARQPAFASASHFPLLLAALAERPLPSDRTLVRLVLDHVADWAVANAAGAQTRQGTLDRALEPALARLRTRLAAIELPEVELAPVAVPAATAKVVGKKRKASVGPGLEEVEMGAGRGTKQRLDGEGLGLGEADVRQKLSAEAVVFAPVGTGTGVGLQGMAGGQSGGAGGDRLSALELLMREARGLLGAK